MDTETTPSAERKALTRRVIVEAKASTYLGKKRKQRQEQGQGRSQKQKQRECHGLLLEKQEQRQGQEQAIGNRAFGRAEGADAQGPGGFGQRSASKRLIQ